MKALAIAALAAAIIFSGSPALAQTPVDSPPGAVAQAPVPAGTTEYDAFMAAFGKTVMAYARNWERLQDCKTWACYAGYFLRIDNILTQGIQWMYQHVSLPCYQEQQQRATKGLQELRGALRMLSLAIQTDSAWRIKVALRKIGAAEQIFETLPGQTCPA